MTQILYLFPDTNLFIQCLDLPHLDWSDWAEFEEVRLIVCRPVMREIDDQRKRGNNRVAKRARKTYSTYFRDLAKRAKEYELIQVSGPCVKLFLQFPSIPDPELSDRLNYAKPDDEIIGCLSKFKKDNPEADARLLTDDTGPMMAAGSLDLDVSPINADWLSPPENNDAEREVVRLREELTRLKRAEPQFDLKCVDAQGSEISKIEVTHSVYEPLSEDDISECIRILENRFPMETEFNIKEPRSASILGPLYRFEPASDEDIAKYKDRDYPGWLEECRNVLANLHEALQRRPEFEFTAANKGTRPGNDTLVVIKASGQFKIGPSPHEEEESEGNGLDKAKIPRPPAPPRGQWRSYHSSLDWLASTRRIEFPSLREARYLSGRPKRDPNKFYYKPGLASEPDDSFSLTCEQWRHGTVAESFVGEIYFDEGESSIAGLLQCEIHAENLSEPAIKRIPVRIDVQKLSAREYALGLVRQ